MPLNYHRPVNFKRPWYSKAISLLPQPIVGQVVELGSGNGELANLVKGKIKNLTMVDINAGKGIIKADFNQRLPLPSQNFNGVISLEVIEHVVEAEFFLKEIHRILKAKGWLIISTPNIAWWGYRLFMLLGNPPKKEGYHLRFFTYHTLTKYLNKAGLRIMADRSFTTIPFVSRFLPKPFYPVVKWWPNMLAQDLVFLCRKK